MGVHQIRQRSRHCLAPGGRWLRRCGSHFGGRGDRLSVQTEPGNAAALLDALADEAWRIREMTAKVVAQRRSEGEDYPHGSLAIGSDLWSYGESNP